MPTRTVARATIFNIMHSAPCSTTAFFLYWSWAPEMHGLHGTTRNFIREIRLRSDGDAQPLTSPMIPIPAINFDDQQRDLTYEISSENTTLKPRVLTKINSVNQTCNVLARIEWFHGGWAANVASSRIFSERYCFYEKSQEQPTLFITIVAWFTTPRVKRLPLNSEEIWKFLSWLRLLQSSEL